MCSLTSKTLRNFPWFVLTIALIGWATLVVWASHSGALTRLTSTYMPVYAILVAIGIAAPVVVYYVWPAFRAPIMQAGLFPLTVLHIWRIPAAAMFLYYGALGPLPAPCYRRRRYEIQDHAVDEKHDRDRRGSFASPDTDSSDCRAGVESAVGHQSWPKWNSLVQRAVLIGPLHPGSVFEWKSKGVKIISTLQEVDETLPAWLKAIKSEVERDH